MASLTDFKEVEDPWSYNARQRGDDYSAQICQKGFIETIAWHVPPTRCTVPFTKEIEDSENVGYSGQAVIDARVVKQQTRKLEGLVPVMGVEVQILSRALGRFSLL